MKRSLWLLMLFLLAGHVPAASADSACEGRFVNPITDICWSCIFPLSLGSIKVSQGKVPDTANPSMPIQICPAPPPLFRRIGLAIGYWEPMALTDVTRSPGCMVNLGFSLPAFGKTAQGTAKKDEKQVNGAFYHVHWPHRPPSWSTSTRLRHYRFYRGQRMPPVLWRGWIPFCRCTEEKKVRNKQVVLLIAGISGIATGIIVSLNIPFIRQGLFYPASPVEIVVSLCLTFSVSVVFFVGAIVGWISVSEIYYSRMTSMNKLSEISEGAYNERK